MAGAALRALLALAAAAQGRAAGPLGRGAQADVMSLLQVEGRPGAAPWLEQLANRMMKGKGNKESVAEMSAKKTMEDEEAKQRLEDKEAELKERKASKRDEEEARRRAVEEANANYKQEEEKKEKLEKEKEEKEKEEKEEKEKEEKEKEKEKEKEEKEKARRLAAEEEARVKRENEARAQAAEEEAKRKTKERAEQREELEAERNAAALSAEWAQKPQVKTEARQRPYEVATTAAEEQRKRLEETRAKLVADMRQSLLAEAEVKVREQMKAKRAAVQAEAKQKKAAEKANLEAKLAMREQEQRLAEERARETKAEREREKEERYQSYLAAQQLRLEFEKEAARKHKAAADRLVEQEVKQAEIARRRAEEREKQRSAPPPEQVGSSEVVTDGNSISVRLRDGLDREISIRASRTGRLKPLMVVACQRFGIDRAHANFTFNGKHVGSYETPQSVGLEDQDAMLVVEVSDVVKDEPPPSGKDLRTARKEAMTRLKEKTQSEVVERQIEEVNASVTTGVKSWTDTIEANLGFFVNDTMRMLATDWHYPRPFAQAMTGDAGRWLRDQEKRLERDVQEFVRRSYQTVAADLQILASDENSLEKLQHKLELYTQLATNVQKWMDAYADKKLRDAEAWRRRHFG